MIFEEAPINQILFNFDHILLEKQVTDSVIFRLLSYTGIGMAYQRDKDSTKAAFYFNKVLDQIHNYPIKETEDTWRVLNIVYQCGEFYSNIKEFEVGNALLEYVVEICSHNHVTYYLARAAYQLALNSIELNKDKDAILELMCDARSFAKINKNEILLNKILALEKNFFQVADCNKLESKL